MYQLPFFLGTHEASQTCQQLSFSYSSSLLTLKILHPFCLDPPYTCIQLPRSQALRELHQRFPASEEPLREFIKCFSVPTELGSTLRESINYRRFSKISLLAKVTMICSKSYCLLLHCFRKRSCVGLYFHCYLITGIIANSSACRSQVDNVTGKAGRICFLIASQLSAVTYFHVKYRGILTYVWFSSF